MLTGFHPTALQLPRKSASARADCPKGRSQPTDDCLLTIMGFAMGGAERPSNSTPLDGFGPRRNGLLVCH